MKKIILTMAAMLSLASCATAPHAPELDECVQSAHWAVNENQAGLLICDYFFPLPESPKTAVNARL